MKAINHLPSALALRKCYAELSIMQIQAGALWPLKPYFQIASKENHKAKSWFLIPFLIFGVFWGDFLVHRKETIKPNHTNHTCAYYSTYLLVCLHLKNIFFLIWQPLNLVNFMKPYFMKFYFIKYGRIELLVMPVFFWGWVGCSF